MPVKASGDSHLQQVDAHFFVCHRVEVHPAGLASLRIAAPAVVEYSARIRPAGLPRPNEEVESEIWNVRTPKTAAELQQDWHTNPRWKGVTRNYTADQVVKLQGTVVEEHTLARRGAEILWDLVNNEDYINSLGALTGNQAVQQVRA